MSANAAVAAENGLTIRDVGDGDSSRGDDKGDNRRESVAAYVEKVTNRPSVQADEGVTIRETVEVDEGIAFRRAVEADDRIVAFEFR